MKSDGRLPPLLGLMEKGAGARKTGVKCETPAPAAVASTKSSNSGLPFGWELTKLSDIAQVNPHSTAGNVGPNDEVSFLPMRSITEETGAVDLSEHRPWKEVQKGYTSFRDGDILFAKITPCMENGKCAIANGLINGFGTGSTEFHVVRLPELADRRFYWRFLLQRRFRELARAEMTGTAGQLRVPTSFLEHAIVPLPPLPEQHRIVAKIDELFTHLDAGVASLKRAKALLKRYRASVLKAACEGRLVPTEAELARQEGREYEPADVLLKRILQERRKKWMEAGRRGRYEEPEGPETSGLPELPEGWVWTNVDSLSRLVSGQTPAGIASALRRTGDVPWFRVGDMNDPGNELHLRLGSQWLSEKDVSSLGIHVYPKGTIVFPKRGGAIATNKKRILGVPAAFDLNTMGVIPLGSVASYIWTWFVGIDLATISDGSSVPQINNGDIAPLPVPLPPLTEQHRIVAEVERLLSLADNLDARLDKHFTQSSRLRQSILKQAFEGKLVPQDPNDEPASVLLERIRKERASAPAQKRTRKRGSHDVI